MKWLFARLSEPSTHAAIGGVAASVVPLVPPPYQAVAQALAFVFFGTAFAKPDQR